MIKAALLVAHRRRRPSGRGPRSTCPSTPGTRYAVVTDKETTATAVELSDLRPARNQGSVGGYREIMLDQLFGGMLGARLDELSQSENPPFLRAARGPRPVPDAADEGRGDPAGARRRTTASRAASTRS